MARFYPSRGFVLDLVGEGKGGGGWGLGMGVILSKIVALLLFKLVKRNAR